MLLEDTRVLRRVVGMNYGTRVGPWSVPRVAGSASELVENSQYVSQLRGQAVVSSLFPVPQRGKKPTTSDPKSSQQIVDNPVPKVVKKKRR